MNQTSHLGCFKLCVHPLFTFTYRFLRRQNFSLILGVELLGLIISIFNSGKVPACQCRRPKSHRFNSRVGKIPWRRKWQSTPVFLPGESHRKRSLEGNSPLGRRVGHNLSNLAHMQTYKKLPNCSPKPVPFCILTSSVPVPSQPHQLYLWERTIR